MRLRDRRRNGAKGGLKAAANMTKRRRKLRARKAARARWVKVKGVAA